jgi:hydrogenase expression/formation protein HypE
MIEASRTPAAAAPGVAPADCVQLDHGTGGGMSQELICDLIAPRLGSVHHGRMEDSAILEVASDRLALTTDSFVVDPIFFGNGDIGKIAVCGTVNDLAVSGAVPRFLTLALVLEEGFPLADLERVLDSIRETALEAGVAIVAGDTKVVARGQVDKLFVNTTGVGELRRPGTLGADAVRAGDAVIVTGQLGNHSIHILSLRAGLGFDERVRSDCAPLNGMIEALLDAHAGAVRCMRDITRGGLGTVLNEIAGAAEVSVTLEEERIPMQRETAMAAEMLGISPLYLANEGNLCVFADGARAEEIVALLRAHPYGREAAVVGAVEARRDPPVTLVGGDGETRTVELLYGAELPRLC